MAATLALFVNERKAGIEFAFKEIFFEKVFEKSPFKRIKFFLVRFVNEAVN